MTSTFLHEDHPISPDELGDVAPPCPHCKTQTWLTAVHTIVSDSKIDSKYKYECKNCGGVEEVHRLEEIRANSIVA